MALFDGEREVSVGQLKALATTAPTRALCIIYAVNTTESSEELNFG